MAKKKLGIGSIEVNKKFKDSDEAFRYAKRLAEHIRYVCVEKSNKNWMAQAMIVVSNMKKDVSQLRYEINGKRGRPKKRLEIDENIAYKWYKGDYTTDYHLHILFVSKPSYAFRNEIKSYIDKNWIGVPNIRKEKKFDINSKKVYKKCCNIKMADYFIVQCEKALFVDCNFGEEEKLKYSLRNYYNEYLKRESQLRRLYRKHRISTMAEDKYLRELNTIESKFETISNYYLGMTKEQDDKDSKAYMDRFQLDEMEENYNKEQEIHHKIIYDNAL